MKLDGEYLFDDSVQEVWDALFDPAVLAAVMPGCEKLDLVDGSYVGEIKVKVGPIQGKFTGKVDLLDIDAPKSYRMIVDGRGAQGFVKANAAITLSVEGGKTKIVYTSEAQVGGKIATVGQRLVETSARAIVKESLQGLAENIRIRAEAHRAHKAATAAEASTTAPATAAAPVTAPAATATATATAAAPATAAAAAAAPAPATAAATANLVASTEAATATDAPSPAAETAASVGTAIAAASSAADMPAVVATPKPAGPVIEYKRADPKKLAGAVAKEVGKTLAPIIILVLIVIAAVIYLLVR